MTELQKNSYQIPALPYSYSALEPVISAEIMELHYTKHHQGYVNNLNIALEKYHEAEAKHDVEAMIALQAAIKFNGGGHINHSIFWAILTSVQTAAHEAPGGELEALIQRDFGGLAPLQEKFNKAAVAIQGSGWGWVGYNKSLKRLEVATTANQDPLSTQGLVPILGVDVWEHAYYLQYKNLRIDYVKAIWKLFHWKRIEERLMQAIS